MSRNILVVGQSHVAAIRAAAKARREADPQAPRTRVIHLGEDRYAPEIEQRDALPRFSVPLEAEIARQLGHAPLVASCISANAHNILGLMRHKRPFDFLWEGDTEAPDPTSETIPIGLVRRTLERLMAQDMLRLRLLADRVGVLVHLQLPPPLADERLIAKAADAYFKDRDITAGDVAPRALRRRLWLLQSAIMRDLCAELGVPFLEVPGEAMDDAGFLREDYAADATHGSAAYGEAWIRKLEAL